MATPAQILLPDPNGMYSCSLPVKSSLRPPPPSAGKNLSGMKCSGSFHTAGSLWIAHTLTNTRAPAGTRWPPTVASSPGQCGTISGSAGCSRSVSLTTRFR
ncbi:Os08g0547951 [Oryza sativa Japonica Group]|uniref:Os08g0547951 protein n=1 Tax=Oryza sativa subsp. japonica TaxID=39947 RepID=A0A0P0XIL1_ORYSJ|nr:hypothetical protein EE612_045769 [Oryza sativa]BAT06561.1 Os08g0547951 [Oryza sativa Japonica Group]